MKIARSVFSGLLGLLFVFSCCLPSVAAAESMMTSADKYSLDTEFDSIIKSTSGEYAMQMDDENNIVPVGRLDVDLCDSKAVEELLLMSMYPLKSITRHFTSLDSEMKRTGGYLWVLRWSL